jgi:hypothetical protein
MSDFSEALNTGANQIAHMHGVAQANNAWSAGQAQIQREWQEQQNAKAMAFNQIEAAKNRNWQEMLSNTAHQREVRDLMAAGLNPVLSAMNGNGASVGSGATAQGVTSQGAKGDTDTSANGAIANLLGSILSAQTQIEAANINAKTQEAVADKYTAMERIVSEIAASASRYGADTSAAASRYGADKSAFASRYHSDRSYEASRYGSDRSAAASMFGSSQAASASRYASDQARAASKYGADASSSASRYGTDTDYDLRNQYGNNQLTGVAGWVAQKLGLSASNRSAHSRRSGGFGSDGRKGGKIIMILGSDIRKTAFRTIGHEVTRIDTNNRGIINRHNKRVLQVLITEPLIHNEGIRSKRQSGNAQTADTCRQAEIIGKSTNRPTSGRRRNLRYRILRRGYPRAFSVFTVKLLPVIPNKTVWNKEIIRIKVDIVHHRRKKGLHTHNFGSTYIERIAGEHLFEEKRDDITDIERGLNRGRAVKRRTRHVNTSGIQRKMRFNITIHS